MARQVTLDHNRMHELLSPFLDGQVTPEEQTALEEHLATCEECARELQSLRWTVALLHQVPVARVPRSFAVPAAQPAPRGGFLGWLSGNLAYGLLRGATALATLLLAIVISVDVLGVGFGRPMAPAPAAAPMPMAQEAAVEKPVEAGETVVVEKVVEKAVEVGRVALETPAAVMEAPQAVAPKAMAPAVLQPTQAGEAARAFGIGGAGTPAPAPTAPAEEQVAAAQAPPPAVVATEVVPPTAAAEAVAPAVATPAEATVVPSGPEAVQEMPSVVPPAGLGLLRRVEIGLFAAIIFLAAVTLTVRRQRPR